MTQIYQNLKFLNLNSRLPSVDHTVDFSLGSLH